MRKLIFGLILSTSAFAGTEIINVDLDVKGTKVVVADIGVGSYIIDKIACVCLFKEQGSKSTTTVDCKKIKAHAELASHLDRCN